jgi:hypothetical protein
MSASSDAHTAKPHDKPDDKKMLEVRVEAPRAPEPKSFSWDKNMRVSEAAREAANAFGYGDNVSLVRNNVALDPNKPLVAAGVRDGDLLKLLDTGGGV